MRITVLDGHILNPGDLNWDALERLGDLTIHERTDPEHIVERSEGADAVLVNKVPLSAETIAALPDLKYIGVTGNGFQYRGCRDGRCPSDPRLQRSHVWHSFRCSNDLRPHSGIHSERWSL